MARTWHIAAGVLALATGSGAALASGDGGCDASWKLFEPARGCASRPMISPGNDSRVNMLLLIQDRGGLTLSGRAYPKPGWRDEGMGRAFLTWSALRAAINPAQSETEESPAEHAGSRCISLASGSPAFLAAMDASRRLPAAERTALAAARGRLAQVCANDGTALADWPGGVASAPGKAFLGYLQASEAFYAGRWDEARAGFAGLAKAPDPWVAEAAAYMLGRVDLNSSIEKAFDEYGGFIGAKAVDQTGIARARAALDAYLRAYPRGSYAVSASGLQRRILWLSGDMNGLAREYARLAESVPAGSEAAASLVEEVDNKLLFAFGEAGRTPAQGALLLAAQDLVRMRDDRGEGGGEGPSLTLAQLDAQRATFAGYPDLWTYLQASHALHVGKNPRQVLQLIPDDARRPAYAPLAFSRQMLRGMALAALGDRNEAGFWLELLGGATALWQRPTVELALALNYERNGKLGAVFAPGSPITDSDIRMILLAHSAGPGLLRAQALEATRPASERLVAKYTLLDKQLRHGDFAGFAASLRLPVPVVAEDALGLAANAGQQIDAFAKGKWSDGYPCPAVVETARSLAANPASVSARLCLGDFWRLNGFDSYPFEIALPKPDELGGVAREFPGSPATRASLYDAIIADPRARPDERAYALYRAINCYGPSGYNGCGGEDVPLAQRRGWFQRLKREFPASQWAKLQRIYW